VGVEKKKLEQCYNNNKNKANDDTKDSESCRIFVNSHENEERIHGGATKLWMERGYNKQHNNREKPELKKQVKKKRRTVLKWLFTMARTCRAWRGVAAWLFNVGITNCRRRKHTTLQ
jgi:hypothetical protein